MDSVKYKVKVISCQTIERFEKEVNDFLETHSFIDCELIVNGYCFIAFIKYFH